MTGLLGELIALDYLKQKGFIFLQWGLRSRNCQIDLVFLHPELNQLIGVEVKASFSKLLLDERAVKITYAKIFARNTALENFMYELKLASFSTHQSLIKVLFKSYSRYQIEYIEQMHL